MAYDLKLTHSSLKLGRSLAAGAIVAVEGSLLCAVLEGGVEKVFVQGTVNGNEKVIGFSTLADALPGRTSAVEIVTVPSAGSLEIDLRNNDLVSGRVRAVVLASGQVLTVDYTYAGATADNAVKVDAAGGRMKFHLDEAGDTITVTYLYDLTVTESIAKFGERHINNRSLHTMHGHMELGCGIGELYTDQFDASADWSSAAAIRLGDGGILTKSGAGPILACTVVHLADASNAMLGVRFSFVAA